MAGSGGIDIRVTRSGGCIPFPQLTDDDDRYAFTTDPRYACPDASPCDKGWVVVSKTYQPVELRVTAGRTVLDVHSELEFLVELDGNSVGMSIISSIDISYCVWQGRLSTVNWEHKYQHFTFGQQVGAMNTCKRPPLTRGVLKVSVHPTRKSPASAISTTGSRQAVAFQAAYEGGTHTRP